MRITRHTDMIVNGRPSHSWYESANGDHVPLPLNASAVPDAVVEKVGDVFMNYAGTNGGLLRTLIAALAQALGEVGDDER
jgi:hypothetical protein